jgi:hypothetical protein
VQIIEVTDFGVRSAVICLRREDSPLRFILYPMIHVGGARFYADVTARLRGADLIVVEGVGRDHGGHGGRRSLLLAALTLTCRIARFNRRLEVVEQDIDYTTLGVPIVCPDVDTAEFLSSWRRIPFVERVLIWSVLPFVIIGRLVGGTEALWSRAVEVNDLPSDDDEAMADAMPGVYRALLDERDERLLADPRTAGARVWT